MDSSLTAGNLVDIGVLCVILLGMARGYVVGLSGVLAKLLSAVVALVVAMSALNPVSCWMMENTELRDQPGVARSLAFVGTILASWVVMIVLQHLLQRVMRVAIEDKADKSCGLIAGVVHSCVLIFALFLVMNLVPHDYLNGVFGEQSVAGREVLRVLPHLEREVEGVDQLRRRLEQFNLQEERTISDAQNHPKTGS